MCSCFSFRRSQASVAFACSMSRLRLSVCLSSSRFTSRKKRARSRPSDARSPCPPCAPPSADVMCDRMIDVTTAEIQSETRPPRPLRTAPPGSRNQSTHHTRGQHNAMWETQTTVPNAKRARRALSMRTCRRGHAACSHSNHTSRIIRSSIKPLHLAAAVRAHENRRVCRCGQRLGSQLTHKGVIPDARPSGSDIMISEYSTKFIFDY